MHVCTPRPVPVTGQALEGLGKPGLQGLLLELSLPKCLHSLSRS